jgi:hypothetical protein
MPYSSFKQSGLDGFKSKKIKRILGNPPGKPLGISATDVGTERGYNNGAANISFTKGAGEEPLYYLVSASPGNITVNTQSTSFLFEGLNSNVSYVFTVTAVNDAGVSEVSDSSSSILITTVPETPVLSSVSYGYRKLTSSFSSVSSGGKSIINYTMSASPSTATSASAGSITISNIEVGTYPVLIFASNANGNSLNSNIINESPFDVTGGTITTPAGYRLHTFTSLQDLVVTGNTILNSECVVVAGGGGGGSSSSGAGGGSGGGGGAGGYLYATNLSVNPGTYSAAVGAGSGAMTNGVNSTFLGQTAIGGGGGGRSNNDNTSRIGAQSGGSGGGSGARSAGAAAGVSDQGNSGFNNSSADTGGGGGGAGAAASSRNGGSGRVVSGFHASAIAGGGGASSRGSSGGGVNGGGNGSSEGGGGITNGSANTGGGGGGNYSGGGSSGGSGIIIFRYAT